jgi:hypothetical protein
LLLAIERRRIAHPKAQDYADFPSGITAPICDRRNGVQKAIPRGSKSRSPISALGPEADIASRPRYVHFAPKADITLHVAMCQTATLISLFDHLDRA